MSYTPRVGDCFHKAAGEHQTLTGFRPTPERNAKVTAMSDKHVVILIDGKESTMPIADFVTLAEKTLANGSTFSNP